MAEGIAFDMAKGLFTNLSSLAVSQIGVWWNFEDDVKDLKSTVSAIQAVLLDAEEKSMTSNLIKDWLEKLKDVFYDADDLLDDFSTEVLRKDLLSGNKVTKEVRLFFSSSNQFAYGLKMGREIKAIKARLSLIANETKLLNLVPRDRPVEPLFVVKRREQNHSFVRKGEIMGRDDDKAALLKLMFESQTEENVFVVPIVGIGGLGKTALAQLVYNDEMVIDHFELRMWCVSDVFDLKKIVADIIQSATGQAPDWNLVTNQLQKQLRDKIDGKKYLLVLDDIWNEEWEQWVSLKKLLMGGAKGSRIIITTRSLRVANITSKCDPHVVKGLSDDDAWSLFKQIAFEQRSADSTNEAFVGIGKQILDKCGGVPLVIRTIAGTLSSKHSENDWLSFKDKTELARISQKEGDILSTLKLSYDHLPSYLKPCFAYCRLYPKDHILEVQKLVLFWIAQGFVKQADQSESLEEIGFGYFKDLVKKSFFQEVEGEEDRYITCKMHDLMHDLAELVAGTESCILNSNLSASEIDENCRHISIIPSLIPLFKGKKLRSLLRFPTSEFENMGDENWDFIISNCRCLRALELDASNLSSVPHSIHKLKHLRYFDLSWSLRLKILPNRICKIQNLQVLKLDHCQHLEELPKKIEKLVNLTHLSLGECHSLTHMPRGIGKLTSLETLSQFVVDKDGSHGGAAADLSELGGLNNLRGELRIRNLGFVKNAKEEFKAANLKGKQHLRSLSLEWGNDCDDDGEKSLEDLQPHPNLKKLCVTGCRSDAKFPNWLSLLTNLVEITIVGSSKFKQLPCFAQLPYLQELSIYYLTELEYMEDNGPNGESESFFPSLTLLQLQQCPKMKSWWRKRPIDADNYSNDYQTVSTIAFPRLRSLIIQDCPLISMPLYPSLDKLLRLVNTSSRPLKQTIQHVKMISNSSGITPSTSSTSPLPLSKLKHFRVENIEGLEPDMLDQCLQNMTSLEDLDIGSCHWLKSLSWCLQRLTGLKKLEMSDCKELDLEDTQWELLKNLSSLTIVGIPKMVSLPLWLQHLTQLKSLKIESCSGLRSLFPVFQHLTSLEKFQVSNCKELELSAAGSGIQIYQDYTTLRVLYLKDIPKCHHLPVWLQHLTNLRELHLYDLPILTSLPDEMRCLTTLEELWIEGSLKLEERYRKDIGADWHKIAHIPFICVNWVRQ